MWGGEENNYVGFGLKTGWDMGRLAEATQMPLHDSTFQRQDVDLYGLDWRKIAGGRSEVVIRESGTRTESAHSKWTVAPKITTSCPEED
jgi:hypothetical protein